MNKLNKSQVDAISSLLISFGESKFIVSIVEATLGGSPVSKFFIFVKIIGLLSLFLASIVFVVINTSLDVSQLVLEYLKILVWPISIVAGIFILKEKLASILHGRTMTVSTPVADFTFNAQNTPSDTVSEAEEEEIKTTVEAKRKEIAPSSSGDVVDIPALQTALLFEKIYNNIYGGQLITLVNLRKIVDGMWNVALESWYADFRENDSILKSIPFSDYIGYLIRTGLVETSETEQGRKYLITDKGTDFLSYIEKSGYSMFKIH